MALNLGFDIRILTAGESTRETVHQLLTRFARDLNSGDVFLLTFSGFGGSVPDYNRAARWLNTWCLYDKQMLQVEIMQLLEGFQAGVRVIVLEDTSRSSLNFWEDEKIIEANSRSVPLEVALSIYGANKDFYDNLTLKTKRKKKLSSQVLWASACQPEHQSYEGHWNGFFTAAVKTVWNGGIYNKNIEHFFIEVASIMPAYQIPEINWLGEAWTKLDQEQSFQI
jgi:hypothetical protein